VIKEVGLGFVVCGLWEVRFGRNKRVRERGVGDSNVGRE